MSVLRMITVGTPTAARLAEIATFSNELHEARDALVRSQLHSGEDLLLARHLVNAGVIAYFRCFMVSDKRDGLLAHIELTEGMKAVHEEMRAFRNRTVAHIDSGLRRTLIYLGVEKREELLVVRAPAEITIHMDPPDVVATSFVGHIEALINLVLEVQESLESQLVAEHGPSEIAELWERDDNDDVADASVLAWNPHSQRRSSFVQMSFVVPAATQES